MTQKVFRLGLTLSALALLAPLAFADMADDVSGMGLVVADDGTVITVRTEDGHMGPGDAEPDQGMGREVVAIAATGNVVWTWKGNQSIHRITLAGQNVLVTTMAGPDEMMMSDDADYRSELIALSLFSGSEVWRVDLPGVAMAIEASPLQIWVVTRQGEVDQPGMHISSRQRGTHRGPGNQNPDHPDEGMGESTLVAISHDGFVLWEQSLRY